MHLPHGRLPLPHLRGPARAVPDLAFWDHTLRRSVWERDVLGTCPGAGEGTLHAADEVEAIARATEDWYEGRSDDWQGPEPRG